MIYAISSFKSLFQNYKTFGLAPRSGYAESGYAYSFEITFLIALLPKRIGNWAEKSREAAQDFSRGWSATAQRQAEPTGRCPHVVEPRRGDGNTASPQILFPPPLRGSVLFGLPFRGFRFVPPTAKFLCAYGANLLQLPYPIEEQSVSNF